MQVCRRVEPFSAHLVDEVECLLRVGGCEFRGGVAKRYESREVLTGDIEQFLGNAGTLGTASGFHNSPVTFDGFHGLQTRSYRSTFMRLPEETEHAGY